jgi:hypothetical protein
MNFNDVKNMSNSLTHSELLLKRKGAFLNGKTPSK